MELRVRASAVCVDADEVLCVRLRDPESGVARLFPPGGAVEAGETPAEAAARETLEETGYRVRVRAGSERVERYPYTWAGRRYDVTTHFFRVDLIGGRDARVDAEPESIVEGAEWVPRSQLDAVLCYDASIRAAVCALSGDEGG
jgi:tRNA(adenine34) deaminase